VSAVAFAQERPQCPPVHPGICFISYEGELEAAGHADWEGDALAFIWVGTNDEAVRVLPDGTMVWHGTGLQETIVGCRAEDGGFDCILDWWYGGSPDGIMIGEGHGAFNLALNACAPTFASATGIITDQSGQQFKVSQILVARPNPGGDGCTTIANDIAFVPLNTP